MANLYKINVIRKTDHIRVGTMLPQEGMTLFDGWTIIKVNPKSVHVEKMVDGTLCKETYRWRDRIPSVYLEEARRCGWKAGA